MKDLKGPIENFIWEESFDFSDEKLGTGWTYRQIVDTEPFNKRIETGSRLIIIPAPDRHLIQYLVEMIQNANECICFSSFLIQKSQVTDELLAAANRGVKIFLLTARESDLSKAKDDLSESEFGKITEHKELLDQFAGNILVRTSDNFHAKYCLVDPNSPKASGIMMTCNAVIDAMSGSNQEIALTLTKTEIEAFFSHFVYGFWEMANYERFMKGDLLPVKKDLAFPLNYKKIDLPVTINNQHSLREKILELIKNAKQSILIGSWSFDEDPAIDHLLTEALEKGVEIKFFSRPNKRNTSPLKKFIDLGAVVIGQDRFHAKFLCVVDQNCIITTSNFTRLVLDSGFEVSVILDAN